MEIPEKLMTCRRLTAVERFSFREAMEDKYGNIESDKTYRASVIIKYAELYRIITTEQVGRVVQVTFEDRFIKEVSCGDQILLFHTEDDATQFLSRLDETSKYFHQ